MRGRCLVELKDGKAVRIFRNAADARLSGVEINEWPRFDAVRSIREQVYKRSNGECERCGKRVTWNNSEMDEKIMKSLGGEVSLENCWMLCHECHQGHPDSKHGNRRWGGRRSV